MEISLEKDSIPFKAILRIVTTGYVVGLTTIFIVLGLVGLVLSLFLIDTEGMIGFLVMAIFVPFATVLQGMFLSLIIFFGLSLYKKQNSIKINVNTDTEKLI